MTLFRISHITNTLLAITSGETKTLGEIPQTFKQTANLLQAEASFLPNALIGPGLAIFSDHSGAEATKPLKFPQFYIQNITEANCQYEQVLFSSSCI